MKPELKRIEAALQQAEIQCNTLNRLSNTDAIGRLPVQPVSDADLLMALDFPISQTDLEALLASDAEKTMPEARESTIYCAVEPALSERSPNLPDFVASEENYRHLALASSALALNLLSDLQLKVSDWSRQLEETLRQIKQLYDEGPIVDGWLESYNPDDPSRTGDRIPTELAQHLSPVPSHSFVIGHSNEPAKPAYRLCGLSDDGQVWYRHCPLDQIPDVSVAIVRHQRLHQLLMNKRSLEFRLSGLTESLVDIHSRATMLNDSKP